VRFKPSISRGSPSAWLVSVALCVASTRWLSATPANQAALEKEFDRFLGKGLASCTTCHLPSDNKAPQSLDEFPHNPFGARLREVARAGSGPAAKRDIATRLRLVAREDADGDGVDNETELLLGHHPGNARDVPARSELRGARKQRNEFAAFLNSHRWQPFAPVGRPAAPKVKDSRWAQNPIDAFVAEERNARQLVPRPEASKEVLLRRVYLDLIGFSPTPAEQRAFAADTSREAYEKVVDRLLADPRHGERWGRHWMDIWRYSDWAGWSGGNQIRDSQPHIWRWRDWIIESLNADKGYDRMLLEMLAADELAPTDTHALRATGFLVRNYKMLSREQWMEDTVKHTAQAFLGLTLGCAKCHDHMTDPVSQSEYYQFRAIFDPHHVRTDKLPGQIDTAKDGLVRAFDTASNAVTRFLVRGDERHPDTNRVMTPGVPAALGGRLQPEPVSLPREAAFPDRREFVLRDTLAASERAKSDAREALVKLQNDTAARPDKLKEQEWNTALAKARHAALVASLEVERLDEEGRKESGERTSAALAAATCQRRVAVLEAELKLHAARGAEAGAQRKADELTPATNGPASAQSKDLEKAKKDLDAAQKKTSEAEKALAGAEKKSGNVTAGDYQPRPLATYPAVSTGRRLAFARWLTDRQNPLTARVAMNHLWLRHFGRGLVATPADFGRSGQSPSHPQLLDWLAAEFMARDWSMKAMHRLIVTSRAYRMASTPDESSARLDPDNIYLWRMNSRRLEAELVRDNLLYTSGDFDATMGGPEIDHQQGLTSKRRSLYLRLAAEKEVEFLKIFDGPAVTECYLRHPTVVPQQALALANSELTLRQARRLAGALAGAAGEDADRLVRAAFQHVLARPPTAQETQTCLEFLAAQGKSASPVRARENLVLVLFNHNDFVTVR
jgi:hypothetical protein